MRQGVKLVKYELVNISMLASSTSGNTLPGAMNKMCDSKEDKVTTFHFIHEKQG